MARWTILSSLLLLLLMLDGSVASGSGLVADDVPTKDVDQNEPELDEATPTTTTKEEEEAGAEESTTCVMDMDGTCQSAPNASASESSSESPAIQCGLFLAKSSIPMAGWGMYTGIPLQEDHVIPPVDVVIPVYDNAEHRDLLHLYQRLEITMGYETIDNYLHSSTGRMHRHTKPYSTTTTTTDNSDSNTNNITTTHITPTRLPTIPTWLMHQYYWDCSMTHNYYDAEHIDSVVPGLGMLANSHPGMILAENVGPARPSPLGGTGHYTSSQTPYQDQSFVALSNIPVGHELFVEYGDDWFADRFGTDFGLSADYKVGNKLAQKWQSTIVDRFHGSAMTTAKPAFLQDLADLMLEVIKPFKASLHVVLGRVKLVPKVGDDEKEEFVKLVAKENPAAYASVPDSLRSVEWLHQEGLCLDHITVDDSFVAPGERGAFAKRMLPKGTVVAPAPVVHMSRDHLTMLLTDEFDSDIILWKGYQLLLNYVYGHVESSLLFFPYANSVNLINHYGGNSENNSNDDRRPNVKLQWSSKSHIEWHSWTPEQLVQESEKAALVMEIVALEDIPEGTEILLDYGNAWQEAYEEHMATTPPAPILPEVDWEAHELLTINDDKKYPGFVQTICWIHEDQEPLRLHEEFMKGGEPVPTAWLTWKHVHNQYLNNAMPCTIVGKQGGGDFYNAFVAAPIPNDDNNNNNDDDQEEEVEVKIMKIPRAAITIVPHMYTNAELRRDAFRHEIQLPDDMVPEHWRDLKADEVDAAAAEATGQCDMYMAESSIPDAGWGLYRGYGTLLDPEVDNELDTFCTGEMVIQVEDFEWNQKLRNRFAGKNSDPEMDDWMLTKYAWDAAITKGGNLEADQVQSYAPGCGMLANSHPLLYNTHMLPPVRKPVNTMGASLGANTHYHHLLFVEQYLKKGAKKVRTIRNGAEIMTKHGKYTNEEGMNAIGKIGLKADLVAIDKVIRRFLKVKQAHGDKAASLVWKLLWNTVDILKLERVAAALPRNMDDLEKVLEKGGAANYQLPDRVRTPEWLEKHATCADNIKSGDSTVELAEKGALAMRKVSKGAVVAPVPLLHLNRDHLDIYDIDHGEGPDGAVFYLGKQLMINYCYGHPESSLLLFPYSPTVNYINHASSGQANVELQWSSTFNNKEWLRKSPEELLRNEKNAGLAMEIVATREIAPGEEIFMDYNKDWEQAWEDHIENWELDSEWDYEPPENEWLRWAHTTGELPDGVAADFAKCHVRVPQNLPEKFNPKKLPEFEWTSVDFRLTDNVYPCEITERNIDADDFLYASIRRDSVFPIREQYTAVVTVPSDDKSKPDQSFISYNMPRRAIEEFDLPYSSPQFYRQAFRHEIGVPDGLFPKAWLDLKA